MGVTERRLAPGRVVRTRGASGRTLDLVVVVVVVCVCVCVCERERECVCVCVCEGRRGEIRAAWSLL